MGQDYAEPWGQGSAFVVWNDLRTMNLKGSAFCVDERECVRLLVAPTTAEEHMADEKKEPWLNYLALTTVIIAVCATLSTFRGSSYSTRTVINQNKASNQWAYYQSKSIKGYLYELQKDAFEMDMMASRGTLDQTQIDNYKRKLAEYDSTIARYEGDKAQIQQDAKAFESERDHNQEHSKTFGMAVIYLQIAILLSSIAALMKKKAVWAAGLAVGIVGLGYFSWAFFVMPG
jgi:hypothetical protein